MKWKLGVNDNSISLNNDLYRGTKLCIAGQRALLRIFYIAKKVMFMEISPKPLVDALVHLESSLQYAKSPLVAADANLAAITRTAAVKSFEYCYALSLKLIERCLEARLGPDAVANVSFRTVMRMAWEQGLVSDGADWDEFREMRNTTAHTYSVAKAAQIFGQLPRFIVALHFLIERASESQHAS